MTNLGRQFRRFWAAGSVGYFGSAITAVALPVLVIQELGADSVQLGLVNASLFVPYAVLGLALLARRPAEVDPFVVHVDADDLAASAALRPAGCVGVTAS